MSFSGVVKEKIARVIGDFFTTNEIVNVFNDANIATDRELFAKWRITLDAFGKMSDQETAIPQILSVFCHPLHFQEPQFRNNFIEKLNTILAYENLKIKATDRGAQILTDDGIIIETPLVKNHSSVESKQKQNPKDYSDETYDFKNGMPHAGCALELFIARKILDKKTRPVFAAKEFSFSQHNYADICLIIDRFVEKGFISLYPNTRPEDLTFDDEEDEENELYGRIKWSVVKRVENSSQELKWAGFDFDIEDEVGLRGITDIGISEFMNDKRYDELGYLTDLSSLSSSELTYEQQRSILLKDIKENSRGETLISISNYPNAKVDMVRTLLSLEKEGILRIRGFSWEYRKNPHLDSTDDGNIKDFGDKDDVYATVRLIQPISSVQEIKITAMPELMVRNIEDNSVQKGKKQIHLPRFPSTPWDKVSIRFLDERNVILSDGKKNNPADFESLGFSNDKTRKPNRAWGLLFGLAKNNGETPPIKSPIPDNVKQLKRQLSDRLKTIFKNDTDPFYDFSETNTYKIKIALILPASNGDDGDNDKYGVRDYLNEAMTSEYEEEQKDWQ